MSTSPPTKVFRLGQVTARLRAVLLESLGTRFWVSAQLVVGRRGGVRAGHFYCELVEVDAGGRQVAKLDAVIWKRTYDVILGKLQSAGLADALSDNTEICAECSLSYHAVYGLKLEIHDVDPTFGESHIQRNRHTIVERLRSDGSLQRNAALAVPVPPLRIGLVTARGSAAHEDFLRTLDVTPYGFAILMANAAMQGEQAERTIVAALDALSNATVDVVCIVRGGGSQLDLAWLDNERIARRMAGYAVPILVGIGHEIDVGVLDAVAHTSFKTPTAVAEFLVREVRDLDERLVVAAERLRETSDRRTALSALDVDRRAHGLEQGARKHLRYHESTHAGRAVQVKASFDAVCAARIGRLDRSVLTIRERATAELRHRSSRLLEAERRVHEVPLRTLLSREESLERNRRGLRQGTRKLLSDGAHGIDVRVARVGTAIERATSTRVRRLDGLLGRLVSGTGRVLDAGDGHVERSVSRLASASDRGLRHAEDELERRRDGLRPARFERRLAEAERRLADRELVLRVSGPEQTLRRGYALVRDSNGRHVRGVDDCPVGEGISITVADGIIEGTVERTRKEEA